MLNANEFFEIVGELYERRYRKLRPGKSVSPMSDQAHEPYEENVKRFKEWVDGPLAFNDAIERIGVLERARERLLQACEESDSAAFGTLSTTFVQSCFAQQNEVAK
jgi:fructose/tagatose bisphosphate aldolase